MVGVQALRQVSPHPNELSGIRPGMRVRCRDGRRAGRVEGRRGEWLLVRRGWLAPVVHRVPAERMVEVRGREVVLDITSAELRRQPLYLSDAETARRVWERILAVPRLRRVCAEAVTVSARDGVVAIAGNVPNSFFAAKLREAARSAVGVVEVVDDLVADHDLELAVATALSVHRSLRPSRVRVHASLGHVALEGELETEADVERAVRTALEVPGVRLVESHLAVRDRRGGASSPNPQ